MQYREKCTNRHLCMRSMINPYNETLKHFRHSKEREREKQRENKDIPNTNAARSLPIAIILAFQLKNWDVLSSHANITSVYWIIEHRAPSTEHRVHSERHSLCEMRIERWKKSWAFFSLFILFNFQLKPENSTHSALSTYCLSIVYASIEKFKHLFFFLYI